jgi:hypothetical protein
MVRRKKSDGVNHSTTLCQRGWEVWIVFTQGGSKTVTWAVVVDVVCTAFLLCTDNAFAHKGTKNHTAANNRCSYRHANAADNSAYQCSHEYSPADW